MIILEKYQQQINGICRKYQVRSLRIFGSALTEDFSDSSDIDFLIELDGAGGGIKRYMNVKFELEDLFARRVDLVMPKAIRNNRIREYIFANIRTVYAA
ncbi:MAG: hypothetical protein D3904_01345 [Candidatus Electrothrix sp. EH2]|nr:hypothetical protein [Candidatus Electrothrix sp. EH2]